ncbi:MAG: hypothetical protein KJ623_03360 [Nanoarchaeota archaeon]|nr:hypothetical protein [Nanoarchaeota archaeon]MBU0962793.1 hypothetical protein [Nanoarchaeota archaeon]
MKLSIRKGFSFGLISGIITTLGLVIGLNSSTHSKLVIFGGIFTIAVADAFSDALGIHISEESENKHTVKQIWESTIATFLSKFFFALTFIIPFLFFDIFISVILSVIWGLSLITIFSYTIAKRERIKPIKVIREHLLIAIVVIIITHFVGGLVSTLV